MLKMFDNSLNECPTCGRLITLGDLFCTNCGTRLRKRSSVHMHIHDKSGFGSVQKSLIADLKIIESKRELRSIYFELGVALRKANEYEKSIDAFTTAANLDGNDPSTDAIQIFLADTFEQTEQPQLAIEPYIEALAVSASMHDALFKRINYLLYFHDIDHDLIISCIGILSDIEFGTDESTKTQIHLLLGHLYVHILEYEKSLTEFQNAVQIDSDDSVSLTQSSIDEYVLSTLHKRINMGGNSAVEALDLQARLLNLWGRAKDALETLEEAIRLSNQVDSKYYDASLYQLKGDIYHKLQQETDAAEAYYQSGQRYSWRNEFQQAREFLEKAIARDSTHARWYWALADCIRLIATQKMDVTEKDLLLQEALQAWLSGSRIELPDRSTSWAYLLRALINHDLLLIPATKQSDLLWEALIYIERALILQKDEPFAWAYLARTYRSVLLETASLQASQRAIESGPEQQLPIEERIVTLANQGFFDQILDLLNQLEELSPSDWVKSIRAYVLMRQDGLDQAFELIDEVIKYGSNDAWSQTSEVWQLNVRAECLRLMQRYEEAKNDYQNILTKPPNRSNLALFGIAAMQVEDYDLAVRYLSQAIETTDLPDRETTVILGWCYLRMGFQEKGLKLIKEGIPQLRSARQAQDFERLYIQEWKNGIVTFPIDNNEQTQVMREIEETIAERIVVEKLSVRSNNSSEIAISELTNSWQQNQDNLLAKTGLAASLAREHAHAGSFEVAFDFYDFLVSQQNKIFPEINLAIKKAANDIYITAKQELATENVAKARLLFEQVQKYSELGKDLHLQGSIQLCYAYIYLRQNDDAPIKELLDQAYDLFSQIGTGSVGNLMSKIFCDLIQTTEELWKLDSLLETYIKTDSRDFIESLRNGLLEYLNERLYLSPQGRNYYDLWTLPIVLELSYELIPEYIHNDLSYEWDLITETIPEMRERILNDTGMPIPGVRVWKNSYIGKQYEIYIRGKSLLKDNGMIPYNMVFCPATKHKLENIGIPPVSIRQDVNLKIDGNWVDLSHKPKLDTAKIEYWTDLTYVVVHLELQIRENLSDFVGVQTVEKMLDHVSIELSDSSNLQTLMASIEVKFKFIKLLQYIIEQRQRLGSLEQIIEHFGDILSQNPAINTSDLNESVLQQIDA